jgi:hypothetical protein
LIERLSGTSCNDYLFKTKYYGLARHQCNACIYYTPFLIPNESEKKTLYRDFCGDSMTKQLFSIFDNKKKFFLISEDELKKFQHYVFDGLSVFDHLDAKNLFHDVGSRQAQNDVRSWQLVCKYCPINLRCEVLIEDTSKCAIFNKLTVRTYTLHAMEEIQYQRQRLHEIFDGMKNGGTCDNHCELCILCDNAGECVAEKALRLLRESRTEDAGGTVCIA